MAKRVPPSRTKAYRRRYKKEYYQRPEVKERRKKYSKKHYQQHKRLRLKQTRKRNLQTYIEKGKAADDPNSLFTSKKRVLRALAMDGANFDKLYKKHWGRKRG